jgi:hypothetical protein
MIVLTIILVAAAISVGVVLFDTQAVNHVRYALANQIAQFGVEAQGWFRTPTMYGGGGEDIERITVIRVARHLNQNSSIDGLIDLPSGVYQIEVTSGSSIITITGTSERPRGIIEVVGRIDLAGNHDHIIVE